MVIEDTRCSRGTAMNCVGLIPQPVEACPQPEIAEPTTTMVIISNMVIILILPFKKNPRWKGTQDLRG